MNKPMIKDDPLYQLIREGKIHEFNKKKQAGESYDFQYADFRTVDLRGIDASGVNFSHAYFRQADLRGIDFSQANLNGASINGAKISGTFFPGDIKAKEILLSLKHGTRMRAGV
jgi:uncharacterized protein YjbI with pentapeptide repeats